MKRLIGIFLSKIDLIINALELYHLLILSYRFEARREKKLNVMFTIMVTIMVTILRERRRVI